MSTTTKRKNKHFPKTLPVWCRNCQLKYYTHLFTNHLVCPVCHLESTWDSIIKEDKNAD